jgi:hypothetical protein
VLQPRLADLAYLPRSPLPGEGDVMGALDRYQAKQTAKNLVWKPPRLASFQADLTVLSFDQSLASTGWIYLVISEGKVIVLDRGTIRTDTELTGWRSNFERARQISVLIATVRERVISTQRAVGVTVMELPAVHGHRTDSSALAAYEVDRYASKHFTPPVFMSIQASRATLGGAAARNKKKLGHAALATYIPESTTRQWNEHQRDAATNGVAYLHKLKQNRESTQ